MGRILRGWRKFGFELPELDRQRLRGALRLGSRGRSGYPCALPERGPESLDAGEEGQYTHEVRPAPENARKNNADQDARNERCHRFPRPPFR